MKCFILSILLLFTSAADAGCTTKDSWHGPDKKLHAGVGAIIAGATTLGTKDPWTGFWIGTGAGALKEAFDANGGGTCSLQDFVVTALGAAAGASLGNWALTLDNKTVSVQYRLALN